MIPKVYTCDGQNISHPLSWSGIPAQTKSIALIMDDPDAPRGASWANIQGNDSLNVEKRWH
ncbi:MAG: YbhB/YbcL family Raf kinase inhibitor-like protein [Desulfomonilaceae bacterium]